MNHRSALDYLPTKWGPSDFFAFSGLDGETDWFHPFVGQTLGETPGVVLHVGMDPSRDLEIRFGGEVEGTALGGTAEGLRPLVIGPDVLDLEVNLDRDGKVRFRLAWLDSKSILGEAQGEKAVPCLFTNGALRSLHDVQAEDPLIVGSGLILHRGGGKTTQLGSPEKVGRFAIVYDSDPKGKAQRALQTDIGSLFSDRMGFYEKIALPATGDEEELRTFVKACGIMKANMESPCGEITSRWSTPDKWPHRRMWLWDSAFNSLGIRHLEPELGRDCIRAVLTKQRPDGFIPHTMAPDRKYDSNMTQPPVLAWGAWELHTLNPSRGFLREVYPGLKKYIEWDLSNMDRRGTGLLQWQFAGPDSGMDNSPRFDGGPDFDAVDLNCFVVKECQALELMATELGLADEAEHWRGVGEQLAGTINDRLWHSQDGFYYDRGWDRSWVRIKTVDDFLPLFAGVATKERAAVLVEDHLTNPAEFWPAFPVPSVALNESEFELDMWRGPTWVNYNWLVICGLRRYGYGELAGRLIALTMEELSKWRARKGSIYEFYDPFGSTAPQNLKRKGKIREWRGVGIPVVAGYFWSAAMFVNMAADRYGLSKP